jgi:hypothetical protein
MQNTERFTPDSDPDQSVASIPSDTVRMEWKPVTAVSFDRDLEVAVIDGTT